MVLEGGTMFLTVPNLKRKSGNTNIVNNENFTILYQHITDPEPSVYVVSNYTTSYNVSSYVGWNVPGFNKLMSQGSIIPMTPWNQESRSGYVESSSWNYTTTANGHQWCDAGRPIRDEWIITREQLLAHVPDTYDQYVNEAAAKIYTQSFDALTSLAEMKQTLRLFTSLAKRLAKLEWPRNWRSVSCEWLQYRYGWRVFVYELQDLINVLTDFDETRTRFSERAGYTETSTIQDYLRTPYGHFAIGGTTDDVVTVSMRGAVVADIEIPKFSFNPLLTGWEKIPFSFVLDWFINVGKTLAAISFACTQRAYTASAGYRVEINRTYHHEIVDTESSFESGVATCDAVSTGYVEVRRPCRITYTPRFILRINPLKIVDLLGLIAQRIH